MQTRLAAAAGALALALIARDSWAIALPIQLDGDFDDWTPAAQVAADPAGDGGGAGIDFTALSLANDDNYLFVRFNTTAEVQPDEGQSLRLYLDTDMNAGTGLAFSGIGADLVWNLGSRSGTFYTPAATSVDQSSIGILIHPTVSSTEFELALRRDAVPAAGKALFPGATLRLILRDAASGGDLVPNSGGVSYTFAAGVAPPPTLSFARVSATDVRVAGYNILEDGLFEPAKQPAFNRILDAIDADVWVFCEVWNHTALDVQAQLELLHPAGSGRSWSAVKLDQGNVIASRFPLLQSWAIYAGHRLTAALIDLYPAQDRNLLVIANHWRCCTADTERQAEADAFVAFLRDARAPGGVITLAQNTPMVACGDFNLVGWRQQLVTALTGDIQDNGTWGADAAPDWDGTTLTAARSRHPDARLSHTWRNDNGSFYPGRLDWMLYTDSVAQLGTHFILDTRTMLPATLAAHGLLASDTPTASDHAPHVADFGMSSTVASPPVAPNPVGTWARLLPNAPNPFNPSTQLRFVADAEIVARLAIYDARGRLVRVLWDGPAAAGPHAVIWDGRDGRGGHLPSGVYRAELSWSAHPVASAPDAAVQTGMRATRGRSTRSLVLVE